MPRRNATLNLDDPDFDQADGRERDQFITRLATLNEHVRLLALQVLHRGGKPIAEPERVEAPTAAQRLGYEELIRRAESEARLANDRVIELGRRNAWLEGEIQRMRNERMAEITNRRHADRRAANP